VVAETKKKKATEKLTNWVAYFFKDHKYKIVRTSTNGDCFFDSVRLGLKDNRENVTIKDLRHHLVESVNESLFNLFRTLLVTAKLDNNRSLMAEFRFMENIDSLDKLKTKLYNPSFWANSWAIGVIEQALNIKILILNEMNFNRKDLKNVITCGDILVTDSEPICSICGMKKSIFDLNLESSKLSEYNSKHEQSGEKSHKWIDNEKQIEINPRGYIIVTYSGNHYRLVTYNNKGFFKNVSELPLNIVTYFYQKCVVEQRFKGSFALIKEFREMNI
jgi:hypothetical protein